MKHPSRRTLMFAGAGAITAALASAGILRQVFAPEAQMVARTVRAIFGSTVLSEADLMRFATDYLKRPHEPFGTKTRLLLATSFLPGQLQGIAKDRMSQEQRRAIEFFEISVATAFIRSTDYATAGALGPVSYLGIPDLSVPLACTNPFARFDADD